MKIHPKGNFDKILQIIKPQTEKMFAAVDNESTLEIFKPNITYIAVQPFITLHKFNFN